MVQGDAAHIVSARHASRKVYQLSIRPDVYGIGAVRASMDCRNLTIAARSEGFVSVSTPEVPALR